MKRIEGYDVLDYAARAFVGNWASFRRSAWVAWVGGAIWGERGETLASFKGVSSELWNPPPQNRSVVELKREKV